MLYMATRLVEMQILFVQSLLQMAEVCLISQSKRGSTGLCAAIAKRGQLCASGVGQGYPA